MRTAANISSTFENRHSKTGFYFQLIFILLVLGVWWHFKFWHLSKFTFLRWTSSSSFTKSRTSAPPRSMKEPRRPFGSSRWIQGSIPSWGWMVLLLFVEVVLRCLEARFRCRNYAFSFFKFTFTEKVRKCTAIERTISWTLLCLSYALPASASTPELYTLKKNYRNSSKNGWGTTLIWTTKAAQRRQRIP